MEHIITSNVMSHLEHNNILYNLQHGFRKARSCESQLIDFIQELNFKNNQNIQSNLIIMDFAKAFDKVPHKRLIYNLNFYGIRHNTLKWIEAFLTDRTQTVVLNGTSSTSVPVTATVPQGTVLGPILFLVYINDFPEYLKHSKLRLFADDSIIYRDITSHEDCQKLQADLNAAARWEADWLMAFHPDKCTKLTVSHRKHTFTRDYTLHNHILESVSSAKYLGVTLQSDLKLLNILRLNIAYFAVAERWLLLDFGWFVLFLKWNKHFDNIASNANRSLGFLKRNLKVSNTEIKSKAYQALARPKLESKCHCQQCRISCVIKMDYTVTRIWANYFISIVLPLKSFIS